MAAVITHDPLGSTLTLVMRARAGDRVALELIADRYRPALMRFAHGRIPATARGLVDTCDVVQVAVVRTLDHLHRIDSSVPGSLLAYLRSAVLNQIRDEIRRARRRPRPAELDDQLRASDRDPIEDAITRDELERYDLALLQLPADQQEAFIMRIEMDCSYREIADALGRASTDSARKLVTRAIGALARLLRRSVEA
jgi:RNA polymerase sigma-70 factor (ECF subfamily)